MTDPWAAAGSDFFAAPSPPNQAAAPVPSEASYPAAAVAGPFPAATNPIANPYAAPSGAAGLSSHESALLMQARSRSETAMGGISTGRRLRFLEALQLGLNLARDCWVVVQRVPALLSVTLVAFVVGMAFAGLYAMAMGGFEALDAGGRYAVAIKNFPLLAVLAVVGTLAQAVVVVAGREALEGNRPSIAAAWSAALSRLPALVGYALIFAAERTVTNLIRGSRAGNLTAGLIDRAWDFATFLGVPVIMFEDGVGPFAAVRRSGDLVRRRFGVQLAATGVIALAVFACAIPLLVLALVIGMAISPVVAVALIVLVLMAEAATSATLQGVLSASMYRFVTTGLVAPGFRESSLLHIFGSRRLSWGPAPAI
jgi:hypothetical protein